MLIAERRRLLLAHVREHGYVAFRDLAAALGISESTVRRDLRSMAGDGLLVLTRGGAGPLVPPRGGAGPLVPPRGGAGPFVPTRGGAGPLVPNPGGAVPRPAAARLAEAGTAGPNGADPVPGPREAIAARAAGLVAEGSAVLLGPGRTTTALARHLATFGELTVVTNSISVTSALLDAPQIDVVLIGGTLRRSIGAAVGPIAEAALTGLRGAQVFLSGDGVTAERGLTTPNVFAAATDQALMAAGQQVVVLADHTKLGRDTMCQTVPADRIDVLVTDQEADAAMVESLRAAGIDVDIA